METGAHKSARHGRPPEEPINRPAAGERCERMHLLASIEQTLDRILTLSGPLLEQGERLRHELLNEDADCYRNALHLETRLASALQSAGEAKQILNQLKAAPSDTVPPAHLRP